MSITSDTVDDGPARHDVTDRRQSNMMRVIYALDGIAADADAFAKGTLPAAVGYDIARRARKALNELESFKARDLLNLRDAPR